MRFGVRHVAVVATASAAWIVAAHWDPVQHQHLTDIPVYQQAAHLVAAGEVPYRDFASEYPPGGVALIALARVVPSTYESAFSLLMFVALALTALGAMAGAQGLGLGQAREVAAGGVVALTPLLLGDFVATRFDLAVAALLAWTLAAAVARRFGWAWALLGVAVAVKLMPLVLVPALVLWQRRSGSRSVGRDAAIGGAVVAAAFLPFLVLAPHGIWNMFDYHLARPLQIESMGASYLLGLSALTGRTPTVTTSYGSQNLVGTGPDVITAISTGLAIAVIAAIALTLMLRLRGASDRQAARLFTAACATTLAAALATGKVFSPQFVVWLLPAALLVAGRYGHHAVVGAVGVMLVTQLYFPYRYWELVALDHRPIALLVIRNLLVIVVAAACWPRAEHDATHRAVPVTT